MTANAAWIHDAIAAVAPISGVGVFDSSRIPDTSWHVVMNTSSGLSIRIQYSPGVTAPQINAGDLVATNLDLTSGGQASLESTLLHKLAKRILANSDLDQATLFRAIAGVVVSEINILRQWDMSMKAAVAGEGTFAALKTAVAALPDLADRTLSQVKTAINNEIDSGDGD